MRAVFEQSNRTHRFDSSTCCSPHGDGSCSRNMGAAPVHPTVDVGLSCVGHGGSRCPFIRDRLRLGLRPQSSFTITADQARRLLYRSTNRRQSFSPSFVWALFSRRLNAVWIAHFAAASMARSSHQKTESQPFAIPYNTRIFTLFHSFPFSMARIY